MKSWRTILVMVSMLGASSALLWPQIVRTQQSQRAPTIQEYNPKSTLVTKEHKPERAKFPFIDIHSHHWNPTPEYVDQLVKEMDTINLRVLVNLSRRGAELNSASGPQSGLARQLNPYQGPHLKNESW